MSLQAGQTILDGKYRILKLIGEGGMARVWLAEEPRFAGRRVAIKEPRADLLPELAQEVRLRYQREVQVCAALEQARVPNVVRALTVELFEDSLLLVMEYMPGGDLAALLGQHPGGLPVERAVAIAQDLLKALAGVHAHQTEIVHRDVKPSNVLFDTQGVAHLADFGLAQLTGASGRSQFQGGQHPGTPMYMAPEQSRSPDPLTPAADLYAVGCVLFEMLTGKRYKRVRPRTAANALRAEVPGWLDAIVARALAEDPWDRWQQASEMAAALAGGWEQARRKAQEQVRQEAEKQAQQDRQERARAQREAVQQAGSALPRQVAAGGDLAPTRETVAARRWSGWVWPIAALLLALLVGMVWLVANPSSRPRPGPTRMPTEAPTAMSSGTPAPLAGATQTRDADGMVMVYVPAGDFLMGSANSDSQADNDEKPQHTVYLDAFWIDQTEVTNVQYRRCVEAGVCTEPACWDESAYNAANQPVVCVDWNQATAYCEWAGARLPTEAQWEKAARGTDGRIYPWGDQAPDCDKANYSDCVDHPAAVGSYPAGASPNGALDMAGNVWEWVSDWYNRGYYAGSPDRNPTGPDSGQYRVLRGGSWLNFWYITRAANRHYGHVLPYRSNGIGFRCGAAEPGG